MDHAKMPCGWGCGAVLGRVKMTAHFTKCPNRYLGKPQSPKRPVGDRGCWLYIAISGCHKFIKIGRTETFDPSRKLYSIQQQFTKEFKRTSPIFRYLAIFRGVLSDERPLLERFEQRRICSEWFHPAQEIFDFAKTKGIQRFEVPKRTSGGVIDFDAFAIGGDTVREERAEEKAVISKLPTLQIVCD